MLEVKVMFWEHYNFEQTLLMLGDFERTLRERSLLDHLKHETGIIMFQTLVWFNLSWCQRDVNEASWESRSVSGRLSRAPGVCVFVGCGGESAGDLECRHGNASDQWNEHTHLTLWGFRYRILFPGTLNCIWVFMESSREKCCMNIIRVGITRGSTILSRF